MVGTLEGNAGLRRPRNSVSAYSPTRPIAPSRRTTQSPRISPQVSTGFSLYDIPGPSQPSSGGGGGDGPGGGWRGLAGGILDNPVTRAAMIPLNLMDYPRRAVSATIEGIVEGIQGKGIDDEGDGFSHWIDRVSDPTYGFGTMFGGGDADWKHFTNPIAAGFHLAGNDVWADRFAGLGGDIALDPFSYLTGSSALNGAGRAQRVSLLARAEAAGLPPSVLEKISRYGISSLDNETRQLISRGTNLAGEALGPELRQAGYYFKVPLMGAEGGGRIPLTGGIERTISGIGARGRSIFNETIGRLGVKTRAPEGLELAYQRIINNRGPMTFQGAATWINGSRAAREAAGEVVGRVGQVAKLAAKEIEGLSPDEWQSMLRRHELGEITPLKAVFEEAAKVMTKYGVPDEMIRANYFPHFYTAAGKDWLTGVDPTAQKFRQRYFKGVDFNDQNPSLMSRKLFVPDGSDEPWVINGHTFDINEGTVYEINRKFREVTGHDFDLLESDFAEVTQRYMQSMAKDVGKLHQLSTMAKSRSRLARAFPDDEVNPLVIDSGLTELANREVAAQIQIDAKVARDRATVMQKESLEARGGLIGHIKQRAQGVLDALVTTSERSRAHMDALIEQLDDDLEGHAIVALRAALDREGSILDARFEAIDSEMARISTRVAADLKAWEAGGRVGPPPSSALTWNELAEQQALNRIDGDAVERLRAEAEMHEILGNRVDSIIGKDDLIDAFTERSSQLRPGQQWVDGLGRVRSGTPGGEAASTAVTTEAVVARADVARSAATVDADPAVRALNEKITKKSIELIRSESRVARLEAQMSPEAVASVQRIEALQRIEATLSNEVRLYHSPKDWERKHSALQRLADHRIDLDEAKLAHEQLMEPLTLARTERDNLASELARMENAQIAAAENSLRPRAAKQAAERPSYPPVRAVPPEDFAAEINRLLPDWMKGPSDPASTSTAAHERRLADLAIMQPHRDVIEGLPEDLSLNMTRYGGHSSTRVNRELRAGGGARGSRLDGSGVRGESADARRGHRGVARRRRAGTPAR